MSRLGLLAVASALVVASSCVSDDAPADLEGSRAVAFHVAGAGGDELRLEGRLFGQDGRRPGVILAHMLPADQRSWFDLADALATEGYRVLTFNFRGYCPGGDGGCSAGARDPGAAAADLGAAIAFLRGEDISSVSIIGASMGGTAAIVASAGLETTAPVDATITLSAPVRLEDLAIEPPMVQTQTAKLFIAGTGDAPAADAAQELYGVATAPKRVEIVPSDAHGSDLLDGGRASEIERLILLWLERYA